jgi:hypothetical protein
VIEVYAFVDLRIVDASQCLFFVTKLCTVTAEKKKIKEAIYWILRNICHFFETR